MRLKIHSAKASLVLALYFATVSHCFGEDTVRFREDVKPILSEHCFRCHGPDAAQRKADLRLDLPSAVGDKDAPGVITPFHPQESELIRRIRSDDPDVRMPPPDAKIDLTEKQKDILERWIASGAKYELHWAFLPNSKPIPPSQLPQEGRRQNAMDAFVEFALRERGLTPSTEADRATLIRRVSLDLVGLPPSPDGVEAFVADPRPDAYDALVDRLLSSPHYGERWGRHWLDQARYADSNGYTIDSERVMWPYRDWVLDAINRDIPFSQFTLEQLAGDLTPNASREQIVATAFHRNTMINEEGGTDPEQFRNEAVVDRVNTTGAIWLGLTVGCAQCHSHKYDPLTHREYYGLFAFFNQCADVNKTSPTMDIFPADGLIAPETPEARQRTIDLARENRDAAIRDSLDRRNEWEKRLRNGEEPTWVAFPIQKVSAERVRVLTPQSDGSLLAKREGNPTDTYLLTGTSPLDQVTAFKLSLIPDPTLSGGGTGTSPEGNFVLSEFEVSVNDVPVPVVGAIADHEAHGAPIIAAIDQVRTTGWSLDMANGGVGPHEAWFILDRAVDAKEKKIQVVLRQLGKDEHLLGRFKLMVTSTSITGHPGETTRADLRDLARTAKNERTAEAEERLASEFARVDPIIAAAQQELERVIRPPTPITQQMIMGETPERRETYVLSRGDFLSPAKEQGIVEPHVPSWLAPSLAPSERQANRADLAKWLTQADQPLTSRVTANRAWMRFFGQGIVETENDFGIQGAAPTHPELLDWLACELIRGEWSMKKFHRAIVLSATYRQSARTRDDLQERDPRNLYLGRQNRLRLDAEVIRDHALVASGYFDRRVGGPPVRPVQPDGVYAFTQTAKSWAPSQGGDRYRRGLYTTFYRSAPYPLQSTFDAPNFSVVCTRRVRSNTPLQALTLANDPVFLELASGLTDRIFEMEGNDGRIDRAFAICFARRPTENERKTIRALVDPKQSDADASRKTWMAIARALMNTDEFITRE